MIFFSSREELMHMSSIHRASNMKKEDSRDTLGFEVWGWGQALAPHLDFARYLMACNCYLPLRLMVWIQNMTDDRFYKASNGLQAGKWARLTCKCCCPWSRFRFNTVLSIHGQIWDTDQLTTLYSFCFFLQGCELHHYSFTDFFFYTGAIF